ncbi:hypothetical protein [Streptomyces sp. NPDC021622]|uniref:hypothetical protein n=1 Tax=Streptomyces sp. NPDC021622 TaxID=3155013 RepID=UPI0033DCB572
MHDASTTTPAEPGWETFGTVSPHPHVVLYSSNVDYQIAIRALDVLHHFAVAAPHCWTVVHELYDLAPPDAPRSLRTGWLTAERALSRGEANGLIAPAEQEVAWHPGDRAALRAWLLEVSVFAMYPQAGRYERAVPGSAGATA